MHTLRLELRGRGICLCESKGSLIYIGSSRQVRTLSSKHRRKHHCGVRETSQWYRAHVVLAEDLSLVRSTRYTFLRCREKMVTEEARIAQDFTLPFSTKLFPPRGMNLPSVSFTCLLLASANRPWPPPSSTSYLTPASPQRCHNSPAPPLHFRDQRTAGITLPRLCCCLSFCLLTSGLGFRSHTNNSRELK